MVTFDLFRKLALSFPEVTEGPHFEKTSFKVGKKIFATHDAENERATVKSSEIDQNVFSSHNTTVVYPVDNKWGKKGWTFIELQEVNQDLFIDALTTAYCEVAPEKLVRQLKQNEGERGI